MREKGSDLAVHLSGNVLGGASTQRVVVVVRERQPLTVEQGFGLDEAVHR